MDVRPRRALSTRHVDGCLDAPSICGFEPVALIGRGGYANVYAYDQQLPRRRVAVKVLLNQAYQGQSAADFVDEVNALAALEHPHIVAVYAAGITDDGRPYLVMNYCPGPTLWQRAVIQPFDLPDVLRMGVQIGSAVATAHARGLLHRDIKPSNMLTTRYGWPVLADFGLAGQPRADTVQGVTLPWTAPEVLWGHAPASPASDEYSLAAALWGLATGCVPGASDGAAAPRERLRLGARGLQIPDGDPRLGDGLDAVLRRAVHRDPGQRYGTMMAFVEALRQLQVRLGVEPTPALVPDDVPGLPRRAVQGFRPVTPIAGRQDKARWQTS